MAASRSRRQARGEACDRRREEFRQHGELSHADPYIFERARLDSPNPKEGLPGRIAVRVRPGTTADFERAPEDGDGSRARLVLHRGAARHDRRDKLRQYSVPLYIVGTIAAFLW